MLLTPPSASGRQVRASRRSAGWGSCDVRSCVRCLREHRCQPASCSEQRSLGAKLDPLLILHTILPSHTATRPHARWLSTIVPRCPHTLTTPCASQGVISAETLHLVAKLRARGALFVVRWRDVFGGVGGRTVAVNGRVVGIGEADACCVWPGTQRTACSEDRSGNDRRA